MRAFWAGLATLLLTTTASAEPATSPAGTTTTGYGFVGTGVLLSGAGGYFLYRGLAHSDDMTSSKVGAALLAGGLVTTGIGVVWVLGPVDKSKPRESTPKQALVLGPTGASYWRRF